MERDLSKVIGVSYDILEDGYYNSNFTDVLIKVDNLRFVYFKSLVSGKIYDIQVNKNEQMKRNFVRLNELISLKNTKYANVDIEKMTQEELLNMACEVLGRPNYSLENETKKMK